MTDHWIYFPCRIGDDLAFIFYDHGLRELLEDLEGSRLLRVKIALEAPHENGLPTQEEFPALSAWEDAFQEVVADAEGAYVGRVTVAGSREFLAYVDGDAAAWEKRLAPLEADHGYAAAIGVEDDPDHRGYWDDLFPSDHDWQVIQDLKVIDALAERGDDLTLARRIDHWATFDAREKAVAFQAWAEAEGFEVEGILEPDATNDAWAVRLHHVGNPRVDEVSPITIRLADAAREQGGEYDGWETSVEGG